MNLRAKIDLTFVFTTSIVAILLYITFQNVNYVKESSDLVNETNAFLYELENLKSSIVKTEALSRGYIITGNENFLENMEEAKEKAFKSIEALQQLHNDHYPISNFEQLIKLVQEKINVSEHNIYLRKNEGIAVAMDHVSFGREKKLMDEITAIIKLIENEEFELLGVAINDNKIHAVNQNNLNKALSLLIFLIILIFHYNIRKNTFKIFSYEEKQVKLIKELNSQNKQLEDFVNIVTHNVRSPANNITALISLVNNENDPVKVRFLLKKLADVSDGLNETLNELVEIIQMKQNGDIQYELLNFKTVFDRIIDSLQGEIIVKDASISCNFEKCPTIKYPKAYLESIAHNLLSNALKYSSPERKPEIRITTFAVKDKPVLQVADNGLGMDLARIGEKLFGLKKTFHTTVNSKGIGLFMTKKHVESLGGDIKVESEVDKGTTFTVYFDKNVCDKPNEKNAERLLHNAMGELIDKRKKL